MNMRLCECESVRWTTRENMALPASCPPAPTGLIVTVSFDPASGDITTGTGGDRDGHVLTTDGGCCGTGPQNMVAPNEFAKK